MKYVQYLSFVTFWKTELASFYFAILDRLGLTRNLPGRVCNTGVFLSSTEQLAFLWLGCFYIEHESHERDGNCEMD